jgi:hypothetical protein
MRLWVQRAWFCAFAIMLFAQPVVAANLKSAERAYKKKDYPTALKEFAPAAKQGNAEAQLYLGKMYQLGQGVPIDRDAAEKWFKASGDQGNAEAQFFLGAMYLLPRKDVAQGLMWMRLSAEQGNQDAQLLLGQTYMQGVKELPRDLVQADMWMRLAAKNNLPFYELQVDGLERQMNSADIAKGKALAAAWKPRLGLRPDQAASSKPKV